MVDDVVEHGVEGDEGHLLALGRDQQTDNTDQMDVLGADGEWTLQQKQIEDEECSEVRLGLLLVQSKHLQQ